MSTAKPPGTIVVPLRRDAVVSLMARMKAAGFDEPFEIMLLPEEATPEVRAMILGCGADYRVVEPKR